MICFKTKKYAKENEKKSWFQKAGCQGTDFALVLENGCNRCDLLCGRPRWVPNCSPADDVSMIGGFALPGYRSVVSDSNVLPAPEE